MHHWYFVQRQIVKGSSDFGFNWVIYKNGGETVVCVCDDLSLNDSNAHPI